MKKILAIVLLFAGLISAQVIERNLTFPDSTVGYTDSVHLRSNEAPLYLKTNRGLAQIDTMFAAFSYGTSFTWYKVNVPFVVDSGYVTVLPEAVRLFDGDTQSDLWIKFYGVSDTTRDSNSVPFILGTKVK